MRITNLVVCWYLGALSVYFSEVLLLDSSMGAWARVSGTWFRLLKLNSPGILPLRPESPDYGWCALPFWDSSVNVQRKLWLCNDVQGYWIGTTVLILNGY